MTAPSDPGVPNVTALQRRVLLAGVATLALFLLGAYAVSVSGAGSFWLLVVMVLVYVAVTRPLLRPVREVVRLRRRLAFQAFLEQREHERGDPG